MIEIKNILVITALWMLPIFTLSSSGSPNMDQLEQEAIEIQNTSKNIEPLYALSPGEQMRDITDAVLNHSETKENAKNSILKNNRKIFVFEYPSDNLMIKGFISFVPPINNHPLLIFLRGGNREWGMINPGNQFSTYKDYTVIGTLYRGGISEGTDEFGGDDVNDVKNLIEFIPTLENILKIKINPCATYMLGASRGGMELFLTLARFPYLQNKIDKIVSLSGLLDLNQQIERRPDMKKMFHEDFGLIEGVNEAEWINKRNPLLAAHFIRNNLPILLIQATDDNRVSLDEGYHMLEEFKRLGKSNQVTYWEFAKGAHTISNIPNRMDLIASWLELNSC